MSAYHKDEMLVAMDKVNQEETEPVFVCSLNVNMLRGRSGGSTVSAILAESKERYQVVF
jgi:hypothetical protein